MFSSFMAGVIKEARKDHKLLPMLQTFDACAYGGLPLEDTEAIWARGQGINLVDLFASTGVGYVTVSGAPINAANGAPTEKLVELAVPKHAPECPHPSLCDPTTGDFITGDVFLEVGADRYTSKGRNDDWIKMEISLRCDTRSIENNAFETRGKDLISAAVVIGAARLSPDLFVEAKQTEGHDELQAEVLGRITPFHERRYKHERILDSRLIIVLSNATLPRTAKGSISRKVVERKFKEKRYPRKRT
ncbi:hypothetical protein FVER53590_11800 [Fusarium verticillioides]|nr:hypothetical protein FVER14953_11800 [Fusarium verticillioides]RBR09747.1 hypothetical protein FVER53590_11800 [Fusarium verticillioides]